MKKLVFFLAACCVMVCAMAQETEWDFSAPVSSGQTLYFDITDEANRYCEVVSGLAFPEGEVVLDAQVISDMDGKTYTVQGIADEAFFGAHALTKITFPTAATFTYIGKDEFYSHVLRNSGLSGELVIPDNVTFIGGTAFNSIGITSLSLGSGVATLNNFAFYDTELTHVVLPNTVKIIKREAFADNSKLTYIEFGNAVEEMNANSIAYCDRLDTIVINSVTPPEINGYFTSQLVQQALLFVPAAAVEAYKSHEKWGEFKMIFAIGTEVKFNRLTFNLHTSYAVNDDCSIYADEEYIDDGGSLKLLSGETVHLRFEPQRFWALEQVLLNGADITSQVKDNQLDVTITEDATLETKWIQPVPAYDFQEEVASGQKLCFSITDALNRKVKIVNQSGGREYAGRQQYAYIEQNGAGGWDLSVDLQPKGDLIIPTTIEHDGQTYTITAIDTLAFGNCGYLTSVSIPEGITAIGAAAFMRCKGLKGKMVLPASCSVLGEWALRECWLSDIDLGGATSLEEFVLLDNNDLKKLVTGPAVKLFNVNCLRSMWNLESVVIGENVEFVSSSSFAGDYRLKTVKILAAVPPVVKWTPEDYEATEWYSYNPSSEDINATLIVPASADHSILDAYKNAPCWQLFATIVEAGPETAVEPIVQSSNVQIIKFVRNGQLYILRDGKTYNALGGMIE